MKVLAINGSPRPMGNVSNILNDLQNMLEREGVEMEIVHIYDYHLTNCNVCMTCEIRGDGRCYDEDDGFNELLDRIRAADGLIIASPTYMNACPSMLQTFLERAMLVIQNDGLSLKGKPGAAIAVCGHEGGTAVYNQLVDFMLKNAMIVIGSNPLTIFNAWQSPQYEDDAKAMEGIRCLVEMLSDTLFRLE